MRDEPEENREHDADDKASHDRKVERGVFAAVNDVTGESAQPKRNFAAEVEESADQDEDRAEEKKRAAEFAKGIHWIILLEGANKAAKQTVYITTRYLLLGNYGHTRL